jgi:hypothetical protein
VKIWLTDPKERKVIWTTVNSALLQQVVQKADNAGVVGIKKLLSGDLTIQLKERAGKEVLSRLSRRQRRNNPRFSQSSCIDEDLRLKRKESNSVLCQIFMYSSA